MKNLKTNLLASILAITIATTTAQAQNYQWAKSFGVSSGTTLSRAVALDPSGNVLTVGTFLGTVDFDPGAGVSNLSSTSTKDVYISKLDAAGNFLWAKRLGGPDNINFPNSANGLSITTDLSGNVIVAGSFSGDFDINPDPVTDLIYASAGGSGAPADGFILKLSPSGTYLWSQQIGSTGTDITSSITADASGNIFALGSFTGTVDFDASAATINAMSAGASDIYILKLTSTGVFSFVKTFGGTGADNGNAITVSGAGNIYTTGSFRLTADFDPSASTANLTSNGGTDVFMSKLNSAGNYVWAKSFGSAYAPTGDQGNAITTDEQGNVFVAGVFSAANAVTAVDFDPGVGVDNKTMVGALDFFVTKLDASGNYVFSITAGSTTSDQAYSIAIDAEGNINILGSFSGVIDFDILGLGYEVPPLAGSSTTDLFLAKYTSTGSITGVNTIGSTGTDIGYGIVIDDASNFHITGIFSGTADFDPSASTANLSPVGTQDAFVTKWNSCSNVGAIATVAKAKTKASGLTNLPTIYASANCEIIAKVTANGASPISGSTTAKVWIETVQPNGASSKYVKRHYEITPAANATTATARVTLYFTQQEFNDFNTVSAVDLPTSPLDNVGIANLLVEKRSGTSNNGTGLPSTYPTAGAININPVDTDVFWNEGTKRWEVSFNTTGFSGFFIKTQSALLPVRWQYINGDINKQNQATVNWTVQEVNVQKYEVEKSNDGTTFNAVKTLNSVGDGEHNYTIIDNVKELNTIYYRVKQIDNNGYYTYSSVVKLQPYGSKQVLVYPNPVKDFVVISVGDKYLKTTAQITDVNGKIVKNIKITSNTFTEDIAILPAGIYYLKMDEGKTEKIIKQ